MDINNITLTQVQYEHNVLVVSVFHKSSLQKHSPFGQQTDTDDHLNSTANMRGR